MHVGAVSHRASFVPPGQERARPGTPLRPVERSDQEAAEPGSAHDAALDDADQSRGVLRLLQQGHFRGVADVRLRINFHDELRAIEVETLTRETREQLSSLAASVDERLGDWVSADWPDPEGAAALDEQRIRFGDAIAELLERLSSPDGMEREELVSGLQTAIDELTAALPDTDSISDAPPLLAELREILGTAVGEIGGHLDAADVLPTLSEPRGNGVAYEKFLAVYQELISPTEPEPSDEDAGFEVIA
jgi:hypothetical protein